MLKPSMNELMKKVGNRYLLVNLAAQRARDIAEEAERTGEPLDDKAVKLALDEIAAGTIVYKPGAKITTPDIPIIIGNNTIPLLSKTNALKNDIIADTLPFEKAVNIPDIKINIPTIKKLRE